MFYAVKKGLRCKCLFQIKILFLSASTNVFYRNFHCTYCEERQFNTFENVWYGLLQRILGPMIFFILGIMELTINHERYNLLYRKKNFLANVPIKYMFICYLMFHFFMHIPEYFTFEIILVKEKSSYTKRLTDFGNSQVYNYYVVFYTGTYYFIIFFGLIMLNCLNLRKYHEYVKMRKNMKKTNTKKLSREEKTFTLMIIITTSTFIITMIVNLIGVALAKVYFLSGVLYDPMVNIFRAVGYLVIALNYICDPFVYLTIDVNLRKIVVSHFLRDDRIWIILYSVCYCVVREKLLFF